MKIIGALVYDARRDYYLVRYNISAYARVPAGSRLLILGGTTWIEVPLIHTWGKWRLLGICNGDMTGICVMIDVDEAGSYIPSIVPSGWGEKNE